MYTGSFIYFSICSITLILFLIINILIIGIRADKANFENDREISIDDGKIIIHREEEIEIKRPLIYRILLYSLFFPITAVLSLFPTIYFENKYSQDRWEIGGYFYLLLLSIFIGVSVKQLIFGKVISNVIINGKSKQINFSSGDQKTIKFRDINEIITYESTNNIVGMNIDIILITNENDEIRLLRISGSQKTTRAKGEYLLRVITQLVKMR